MKQETKQTRSSSSIVAAYTAQIHKAENQQETAKFVQIQKQRQKWRDELGIGKDKKQEEKGLGEKEAYRKMRQHQCPIDELYNGFFEGIIIDPEQGLQTEDVRKLTEKYGLNRLTMKDQVHWLVKLFHEMTGFFALMLWVAALLCFIAYALDPSDPANLVLAIALCLNVTISGLITFFQNNKSESMMEAIQKNQPQKALVKRNGQQAEIEPQEIVPGDIVIVNKGDKIPADLRMIQVFDMKVDNSTLTGESDLQTRTVDCTCEDNALESKNIAFFATDCGNGSCESIAILTGDRTMIGQIAGIASTARNEMTPLRMELNIYIKQITVIACSLGIFFFISGFVIGYDFFLNLIFAIGIIVANVPEGMFATITIALSLSAAKLAYKKVIVKNLEAVETLGSTSCICSDKTGTLTQNKMTVEHIWVNNSVMKAKNSQKYPKEVVYDANDKSFRALHDCAVICSQASFNLNLSEARQQEILFQKQLSPAQQDQLIENEVKKYQQELKQGYILDYPTFGDATESGLIKFYQAIENIEDTRQKYETAPDIEGNHAQLPFNSSNKYAYYIVKNQAKLGWNYEKDKISITTQKSLQSEFCLFAKGAPERIWKKCTHILIDNVPVPITDKWEEAFETANQQFANNGQRVIGFSQYHFPAQKFGQNFKFNMNNFNFQDENQIFLGLVSLIDPPRDAVPYSILQCQAAGIKVIMVTGDQELTATSIARQINIINQETVNEIAERTGRTFDACLGDSDAIVISGDRLARISAEEESLPFEERGKILQSYLRKSQIVFARTSPAQKLIIVEANQSLGYIVAATGDGVNDSPAIKKADIGVAMGIAGTEVTKDAADMILANDDFSAIVVGIEEGRKIFENLKKAICYIMSHNIPQLIPFLMMIITAIPLGLATFLILVIDLSGDMIPGIAIAHEEGELDIMVRKPRNKEDRLATNRMFFWPYLLTGINEAFAVFVCYFMIFNDFGFPMKKLWFLNNELGIMPEDTDTYDPSSPFLGSTTLQNLGPCKVGDDVTVDHGEIIDWFYIRHANKDLRMAFVQCVADPLSPFSTKYQTKDIFGQCHVRQISPLTHRPVCYSTESLQYVHTAVFTGILICQITNSLCVQTRKLSMIYQGMKNYMMFFGYASQITLTLLMAYVYGINFALGTRDIIFIHYGIGCLPFCIFLNVWEETRKFCLRNLKKVNPSKANWFQRNTLW